MHSGSSFSRSGDGHFFPPSTAFFAVHGVLQIVTLNSQPALRSLFLIPEEKNFLLFDLGSVPICLQFFRVVVISSLQFIPFVVL